MEVKKWLSPLLRVIYKSCTFLRYKTVSGRLKGTILLEEGGRTVAPSLLSVVGML